MADVHDYRGADGTRLSYTSLGAGPIVLLLHGLYSNADTNWVRYGTAQQLADAGYRAILPDFRGHGHSDTPTSADGWPADVLASDIEALVETLQPGPDFVLGGYSLGCRTAARLLVRGLRPRAAILAGMGLDGIRSLQPRADWHIRIIRGRGSWPKGSAEYHAERFLEANIGNPDAMIPLLQGQVDTDIADVRKIALPTLVLVGNRDEYRQSALELADVLPAATFREIPGNHMTCISRPELGARIVEFLHGL